MRDSLLRAVVVCAIALSVSRAALAQAPDRRPRNLFLPAQARMDVPAAAQRFKGVVRSQTVGIDLATLMAAQKGDTLRLNLFNQVDLDAVITTRRLTHRGSTQWRGTLRGIEGGTILLAEVNNVVAGIIRAPSMATIRIFSAGPGRYQLVQIDEAAQPECGLDPDAVAAQFQARTAGPEAPLGTIETCDTGTVVDLAMVYTKSAREAAAGVPNGDPSAILAEIDLTELDFNTILTNSLVNFQVNVVGTLELFQNEIGSFSTILNELTATSDGVYDEVHPFRDSVTADVVCMLINDDSLGGIAWIMTALDPAMQSKAFNVNNWARAADSVVAHEVGHNMGCCHDRDNCGGGIFPYSWGHRFTGDDDVLYRTVMSYRPGAWIKYYSNPNVTFAGQPTGEVMTDNARTLNETVSIVANYRQNPLALRQTQDTVAADTMLLAGDPFPGDMFGTSVDIEGDIAVVGALAADGTTFTDTGAAYVFSFDGALWNQDIKLLAPDGFTGDNFGVSVAISGDLIVVGAQADDDNGTNSGAAYVYRYDGAMWQYETKLTPDPDDGFGGGAANDFFGRSVAVSGNHILVGANRDDDNLQSNSGSVYVFEYDDVSMTWSQQDKLHATDPGMNDEFGVSVSLDGDVAVVGAWQNDEASTDAGGAYIFRFDSASWNFETKLIAPDAMPNSFLFGVAVGISNEVVVVGARGDNKNSTFVGSAFVFSFDGLSWINETKLSSGDDDGQIAPPSSAFGAAVDIMGDEIAVGAWLDDVTLDGNEGAVYPYTFFGGQWLASPRVVASDAMPGDGFGVSVAVDAGVILAGAWQRDGGTGAVYVFAAGEFFNDCNNNGHVDSCDILEGRSLDCNENGVPDECDLDPMIGTSLDCNGNGIPDECDVVSGFDSDCNANGIPDQCDLGTGVLVDTNFDGIADVCQDCNNNGTFDPDEISGDPSLDCNLNGVLDLCDIADGTSTDLDLNGQPDECADCNMNGVSDFQDIANGAPDLNGNNQPDECEPDCNGNSVPDDLDIANGTSFDGNEDGVPDECEPDCDGNGVSDNVQIIQGTSEDCNYNGIPDACDIGEFRSNDCNKDAIPDECELADGTYEDINLDGVPDICQDCNNNGIFDDVEITITPTLDCNLNLVMDMCESPDINGNGLADFCEDCNHNLRVDWLDVADGTSLDLNLNNVPDECERVGDTNQDGNVDVTDLLNLLANWGFCTVPTPGDVNYDGVVDVTDLLLLLANWG